MDEKTSRLIEYTVEALVVTWLGYLFLYQNYLLYRWHRGLPLPSRSPFILIGVILGILFFWYEWNKFEKELARREEAASEPAIPVVSRSSNPETEAGSPEEPSERTSETEESEGATP
ncbi:hypothetical protein APY94_06665 [Thermococcus celericrescens]|uniref:Uncharacterized protein n=1 Tax=Thermococcus celericrescens TaxID=227598 RepID=A0A100XXN0_9EURY|nr:hypothetical protein [Thermococcus celericrescens]KUH33192.1 hypothetical protein APY94_06665 [Thermococcus celericrescens]